MSTNDSIEKVVVPVLVSLCGLVLWGALQATCVLASKVDSVQAARIQIAKSR